MNWRRPSLFASAALLSAASAPAFAAGGWDITPQLNTDITYEDNPSLATDGNEVDSFGAVIGARLNMVYAEENRRLSLTPRARRPFYFDDRNSDLEKTDFFLDSRGAWGLQRSSWDLDFRYSNQSVVRSEFADINDPDNPGNPGDSGRVLVADDTQERFQIQPTYTYSLTTRDFLSLSASYTDVNYDKEFTGRADYDSSNASLTYRRVVNSRLDVSLSGSISNYQSEQKVNLQGPAPGVLIPVNLENETDTSGFSLRLNYSLTDRTDVEAVVGLNDSDFEGDLTPLGGGPTQRINEGSSESDNYRLDILHRFDDATLNLSYNRVLQPSSSGTLATRDQVSLFWTKVLSAKARILVGGNAYRQESVSDVNVTDYDFLRAELKLDYQLLRDWSVETGYTYLTSTSDFGTGQLDATNNRVFLGIRWAPPSEL